MRKNVFVIGREDFNFAKLRALRKADNYTFHGLLDYRDIRAAEEHAIGELFERAEQQLRNFNGSVDAIVGYWDFPVSDMVPFLCRKFGLPSASLNSVIKCEHKYWSRVEQWKVIPESIPRFCAVDPFDDDAFAKIDVPLPFWIKPVKSFRSHLAFRVRHEEDFHACIAVIRENIQRIGNRFNFVLEHVDVPEGCADIDGNYCIVEEEITGRQCTLEGYAFQNEVTIYGIVDSIRDTNRTSFARYEYPSRLPKRVQRRMIDAAEKFVRHIGFNNAAFNIEFFYNPQYDRVSLLEINPRTSQSHSDLFEKVDGTSNFEVMVDLALGNQPDFMHGQGDYRCAAKFFIRRYEDALVREVPDAEQVQAVQQQIPDTLIQINVKPGMRLSDLLNQDSYSYEIADVFIGAENSKELLQKYRACVKMLPFQFGRA